jgi:hypothetical protein
MANPSMLLLLLVASCAALTIANDDPAMISRFDRWMIKHGRAYTDAGEKQRRFDVYRKNVELIEEFNSGSNSYTLTDNKFADLTNEEFRAKVLGLGAPGRTGRHAPRREELVPVSFLSLGLLHMFYSSGS